MKKTALISWLSRLEHRMSQKFKVKPGLPPPLRFDILEECERRIPGFPIVLHGASSVPQDIVAEINRYGGKLENAAGVSEDQLRRAAASAVCKINIDSDGRLAMTAAIRKVFVESPGEFDPRKYLGPARDKLKELYKHKIVNMPEVKEGLIRSCTVMG